ncbi:MAG: ABC transporter ATP-binding protein [Chloroflexi bacterium]|nr:ABC transporter ATP-binding protein [Chloroflexota bacterium]
MISARGLTKYYGRRRGLDGLDLEVQQGEVYGFLGPNGAGKTTTIRILLDLIRPTAGSATILGETPRRGGQALRRRVGYLPGDFVVAGGQSARELLTHLGHLRGGVAPARIEALAERFELDLGTRIGSLSRGNRQKVGVVQAFMHEPELLILDEPTTGLDPLMQQRFLDLVAEVRAAGQTVFMSSHVLSEVQQSADRVGIVRDGRTVAVEAVETLRQRAVRKVEVRFDEPPPAEAFAGLPDVVDLELDGPVLHCRLTGRPDAFVKAVASFGVASLTVEEPDLEEHFFEYYLGEEAADVA